MLSTSPVNIAQKGVLFIPDISGFTEFINQTEITHSQHIIEELLEIIIEDTKSSFEISEIEGDAVLFYRYEENTNLKDIKDLCIQLFEKFHQHLQYYKRDRVCDCGACTTTDQLSLKFIVHRGFLQEYEIAERKKLMGKDVIYVHRLLKNTVPSKEYILVSNSFNLNSDQEKRLAELEFLKLDQDFENYGNQEIWYFNLNSLKENIPIAPPRVRSKIPEVNLSSCISIRAKLPVILKAITEPEKRLKWTKNLKKIELKDHRINRIKTSHECIIGQNHVQITLEDLISNDTEIKLI